MKYITLVERDETPLWVSLVLGGCANRALFEKSHGIDFTLRNYRFLGRVHQIGEEDLQKIADAIDSRVHSVGLDYFAQYESSCRFYCDKLQSVARLVAGWSLPAPRDEIRRRLMLYLDAAYDCMPFMVSIFAVQSLLTKRLGETIAPFATEAGLPLDSALTLLSRPATPTAIEQDSKNMTVFVEEIMRDNKLAEIFGSQDPVRKLSQQYGNFLMRLRKHCRDFGWLQTFTYRNRPYGLDDLIGRLRDRAWRLRATGLPAQSSQPEGNFINEQLAQIEKRLDRETRRVLETARRYATLRFHRVDVHFMTAAKLTSLMEHSAEALDLPYELLCYLTPQEIDRGLQSPGADDWRKLAVARQNQGFDAVLTGTGAVEITSPTQVSTVVHERGEPLLHGMTASPGNYAGSVKVVRSLRDCAGFERGDVLVSPMTTPEFMSAIEKAGAIVTDEGGLLCHAAIISRELGIPCIIGTRVASHVLRANEHVTVSADAGSGIVYRNDF